MLREIKQDVQVMVTEGQKEWWWLFSLRYDWFLKEFLCLLGENKHSEKSEQLD